VLSALPGKAPISHGYFISFNYVFFKALGAWRLALGAWSLELGAWSLELVDFSLCTCTTIILRPTYGVEELPTAGQV